MQPNSVTAESANQNLVRDGQPACNSVILFVIRLGHKR